MADLAPTPGPSDADLEALLAQSYQPGPPAPVAAPLPAPALPPPPGGALPPAPAPQLAPEELDRIAALAGPPPAAAAPAAPPPPPATIEQAVAAQNATHDAAQKVADAGVANAQEQADAATAAAQKKADLLADQRVDLQAEQQYQRDGLERATADRDRIEKEIADTKLHNLWETASVPRKFAALAGILLGGFSFDAHHVNQAAESVDRQVAEDLNLQKERLGQKFQLLSMKNTDLGQLRQQYEYENAQLQLRQGKALESLGAQLDALSAKSKNQEGVLKAQAISAELKQAGAQAVTEGFAKIAAFHTNKLKDAEIKSVTAKNYAEAAKARADGTTAKLTKAEQLANDTVNKQFDKEKGLVLGTARSPGPLAKLSTAESISEGLKQAIASGDPNAIKEAVISAREQATRALTGSAPTKLTVELQSELQSSPDALVAKLSHLTGNPTESKKFAGRVLGLIDGIAEEQRKQVDDHRSRIVREHLGVNGRAGRSPNAAINDAMKRAALGNINGLFGEVRNADGSLRYTDESAPAKPATAAKPAASAPAGKIPTGGRPAHKGTVAGYVLNGEFVAL